MSESDCYKAATAPLCGTSVARSRYRAGFEVVSSRSLIVSALAASVGCSLCAPSEATSVKLAGKVVSIVDGDTIDVVSDGQAMRVRLNGIDAPNIDQPYGAEAKQYVSKLTMNQLVKLTVHGQDREKHLIADVELPHHRMLTNEVLRAGLGWYRKDSSVNPVLQQLEQDARGQRVGLWSDSNPTPPWNFHQSNVIASTRLAASAPDSKQRGSRREGDIAGDSTLGEKKPLMGGVARSSPRDNVLTARASLESSAREMALQGLVDEKQKNLVSPSAVMKIVQLKLNGTPVCPLSVRQGPDERLRSVVDAVEPRRRMLSAEQPPLRAMVTETPLRSGEYAAPSRTEFTNIAPSRSLFNGGPPLRLAMNSSLPVRSLMEQAPVRPAMMNDQPPERPTVINDRPPEREIQSREPAVERVSQTNTSINMLHSPSRSVKGERRLDSHDCGTRAYPRAMAPLSAAQELLLWDQWYSRVNDLLCKELSKTMKQQGSPAGSNVVHIKVSANHQVLATLVQSSNRSFDDAILAAYTALDGNPKLEFPHGTQRIVVEYESSHSQDVQAPTGEFDKHSIRGDRELIERATQ